MTALCLCALFGHCVTPGGAPGITLCAQLGQKSAGFLPIYFQRIETAPAAGQARLMLWQPAMRLCAAGCQRHTLGRCFQVESRTKIPPAVSFIPVILLSGHAPPTVQAG
ncbi:MAG: hypothetical protein PHO66_07665 [Eubacteriales bacterium]|nr:hypothetical protein [Eubacteriales bacterium]